jgi:hypothetical protein
MVELVSLVKVIEAMEDSRDKNAEVGAGIADLVLVVRNDNEGAVRPLDHQLLMALLMKAVVPNGHHLIDEVAVELHRHRDRKSQSGLHASRVGADRFLEVSPQLGEVLHEINLVIDGFPIDTADELEVIKSGQLSLKGPAKGQWPRDAHPTKDRSACRSLSSSDQADERGLARSITPQEANLLTALDPEGDIIKDDALAALNVVALGDISEFDHDEPRVT